MNRLPEDDDPTIICNVLEQFRANSVNYYRSSMLPSTAAHETNAGTLSTRPRKLKFDFSVKSESEYPDKRMKFSTPQQKENNREVMSPWEIRRIKAEMIKSRAQVIEAEERISKLQHLKLDTELLYAKEKKSLEEALHQERQKVCDLETRLEFVRNREAEAIDRYKQIQFGESNKKAQQILSELQKENFTLKEQLFECQNEMENLKKADKDEVNKVFSEMELLKENNNANVKLIESLKNELSEKGEELRKLEMEQTKLLSFTKRVKDLESERDAYLEMRMYVESQNKKLRQFSEMEKELVETREEVKRLKASISNTMYLEELVEDLKNRNKEMANLDQQIVKLRIENQNQRNELDSWCDLAKHYCLVGDENTKPFMLLKKRLEELIQRELSYVSENKTLELKTEHLKEKLIEKDNELTEMKKQCEELKAACEAHASSIKRIRKQFTLVSWERNDLRNVLDSCQKEMTMNSEAYNQFEAFQKVIDNYRQRVEQIENDPSLAVGLFNKNPTADYEKEELPKRELALKEENKILLEKVQQLSDQLEYRTLKGDFDPRQTKVIHLKTNPTSEAIQNYVDKLTKANEKIIKLKERIKVMEEGGSQNVTQIVEERVQTNSSKEVTDLKEKLKSLEIQNQRLCEVFKKKSHDFRDAMYILFGYKIDVLSTNQYRLCSQYAFDPQDILLFQISSEDNGTMELLETPFSQTLTEFIDLHLKRHRSIPLFLASVTNDLFNKQTMTMTSTMMESTLGAGC